MTSLAERPIVNAAAHMGIIAAYFENRTKHTNTF